MAHSTRFANMGQTLVVPNVCRKGARGAGLAGKMLDDGLTASLHLTS